MAQNDDDLMGSLLKTMFQLVSWVFVGIFTLICWILSALFNGIASAFKKDSSSDATDTE
jgi:hypothetical protein